MSRSSARSRWTARCRPSSGVHWPPDRRWVAPSDPAGGRTVYRDIVRLAPGHAVVLAQGRWQIRRWWTPGYRGTDRLAAAEAAGLVRGRLIEAVGRRLPETGRPAILLSGG